MPDYSLPYLSGTGLMGLGPIDPQVPQYAMGSIPGYAPTASAGMPSGGGGLTGALSAGAAGIGSAFGLINGIGQLLKAKRIHPERPEYEIPEETKQMLGLRQSLLNAGMPGEQQAKQDILTSQSNALGSLARGATDQSQYLGLLGAITGQTNNAFNNLETQRAANYQNNVAGLERAQQVMSAAKDKEWELNKYDPYLMDLQRKYQLQNAGNQNIATGLTGLTSLAAATGGSGGSGGGGLASLMALL